MVCWTEASSRRVSDRVRAMAAVAPGAMSGPVAREGSRSTAAGIDPHTEARIGPGPSARGSARMPAGRRVPATRTVTIPGTGLRWTAFREGASGRPAAGRAFAGPVGAMRVRRGEPQRSESSRDRPGPPRRPGVRRIHVRRPAFPALAAACLAPRPGGHAAAGAGRVRRARGLRRDARGPPDRGRDSGRLHPVRADARSAWRCSTTTRCRSR